MRLNDPDLPVCRRLASPFSEDARPPVNWVGARGNVGRRDCAIESAILSTSFKPLLTEDSGEGDNLARVQRWTVPRQPRDQGVRKGAGAVDAGASADFATSFKT